MRPKKIKVRAGRGTITARGPTAFRAEIMIDGERVRETFPSEEDAQRFLDEVVRRSVKYGISLDKTRVTWKELVESFLDARELAGVKKTTMRIYRDELRYCKEWEDLPVQRLTAEHITRLLSRLKKAEKPLAPKSLYNIRITIHGVLRHGVALDILDRNVCDKVKSPQVPESDPEVWTKEQLRTFLRAIEGDRVEALLWTIAATGMRKGEAVALRWSDVKLETGEVVISKRITRVSGGVGIDLDTPKSRAGSRVVYLPPQAIAKLTEWRTRQQLDQKLAEEKWKGGNWVFTGKWGNHLEPRWINRHLTDLLRRHGLEHITVHGLRHTFVTLLLQAGESLRDVQTVVGHSRPSVTLNMYWRVLPGASARVATRVGELLADELPQNYPKASIP